MKVSWACTEALMARLTEPRQDPQDRTRGWRISVEQKLWADIKKHARRHPAPGPLKLVGTEWYALNADYWQALDRELGGGK